MSKLLRNWFPVFLYSGIIFYFSSLPRIQTPVEFINFDKVLHIFEYTPFGYLLARAFSSPGNQWSKKELFALVTAVSFLYGCSDEYHQSFVDGRNATFADVIFDTIGGICGGWLYRKFKGPKT